MGRTRTIRVSTANRGGISHHYDICRGSWSVLFQSPDTGELVLAAFPADSKKSVRQLLEEQGIDIAEAIVEFNR